MNVPARPRHLHLACVPLRVAACALLLCAYGSLTAAQTAQPERTAGQGPSLRAQLDDDVRAMQAFRPSFPFWRHVFTVPDGAIAFGSAVNGRLLATFPTRGDWVREAAWEDTALAPLLAPTSLPADLGQRRDSVVQLLEPAVGPVIHNPTRGRFVAPNAERYGIFLEEWGRIYERFGVPAEVGLAQALVESGLNGAIRSEARAVGFCQWLRGNWRRLQRLSPHVIEAENQTTQAAYCAAYLAILATRYGSFVPALSEHHAGGTNVGRTIINGARLGGADIRERYFLGAEFARDLRSMAPRVFTDLFGTYGPRSFFYAEMVFGNMAHVVDLRATMPQSRIFAVRSRTGIALPDVVRATGLPADTIRRFNPALTRRVPARGTLYLPRHVERLGTDVAFWHRPPPEPYAQALAAFFALRPPAGAWDSPDFDAVLQRMQRRFAATASEEGTVMATVLAYVLQDRQQSGQRTILAEFSNSPRIRALFEDARAHRDVARVARAPRTQETD